MEMHFAFAIFCFFELVTPLHTKRSLSYGLLLSVFALVIKMLEFF